MALNFKGIAALVSAPVISKALFTSTPKPVSVAPKQVAKPLKPVAGTNTFSPPKSYYAAFKPFDFDLPDGEYTILHALKEMHEGRKGTLMIVKKSTGIGYKVTGIYEEDKVGLQGPNGMSFRPKVGLREIPQYYPVWR